MTPKLSEAPSDFEMETPTNLNESSTLGRVKSYTSKMISRKGTDQWILDREERRTEAIEDYPVDFESGDEDIDEDQKREKVAFDRMFNVISLVLLIVLVLLAIFVSNFESWISLVGGIAANSIAFI